MGDVSFFLDKLIQKAKTTDDSLLSKIKDESFYNSLCNVCDVIGDLGFEFIESQDEDFNYKNDIILRISSALIKNYFTLYYVNFVTGEYVGYSSSDDYNSLKIEESGSDFFNDIKKNAKTVIYKDDIDYVINSLDKDRILNELKHGNSYTFDYRLLLNDIPTYVTLKAFKLSGNDDSLIIGVSNIDEQKKRELEYKKAMKANITYSNIALALATSYSAIYYVDINTSLFIEYSLDNQYQVLKEIRHGDRFFERTLQEAKSAIIPEDQERFLGIVNKDNLINEISKGNIVKVTYRLIIDGKPEFVELSAMKLSSDASHIILAVTSIDSWKKKEDEYNKKLNQEKLLARTDALTNTLNKFAYKEIEKKINKEIKNDSIDEFSVFVFDINNLKTINDTLGHAAGDKYIKSAKRLIKKIFKQDDLYRIGGDEFTLILNNSDYYIRDFLYEKINLENQKNKSLNKVTVAVGMADYNKDTDSSLADVFKKADDRMYEYKKKFKCQ